MMHALSRLLRKFLKLVLSLFLVLLLIILFALSYVWLHTSNVLTKEAMRPIVTGIISSRIGCSVWHWCNEFVDKKNHPSPAGKHSVFQTERCYRGDCVVTIELGSADSFLDKHAICIFHLREDHWKTPFPEVTWLSENELEVKNDYVGKTRHQEYEFEGVKITYKFNPYGSSPPESLAMLGIVSYPDTFSDCDFHKAKRQIDDLEASGQISREQNMRWDLDRFQSEMRWRERDIKGQMKAGQ